MASNSTFYYSLNSNPTDISYSTTTDTTLTPSSYTVPTGYSLIEVIIGDNVTDLSGSCFSSQASLAAVSIGSSVQNLNDDSFVGCSALTSITIPLSVIYVGQNCFAYCTALTSVTIGDGVVTLDTGCFAHCTSLTSIVIPSSVTTLNDYVFQYCGALTLITYADPGIIGGAFTSFAFEFTSATLLVQFYDTIGTPTSGVYNTTLYPSTTSFSPTSDSFSSVSSTTTFVYYSTYTSNTYYYDIVTTSTLTSSSYLGLVPTGYNLIGVTIGDSVTDVSGSCFSSQQYLAAVDMGSSVQNLNDDSFVGCSALTSITIPLSVIYVGQNCFAYCTALTSVTIGDGVVTLDTGCFAHCTSLTSIVIPSSVTTLNDYVFQYCGALTLITYADPGIIGGAFTSFAFEFTSATLLVQFYDTIGTPTSGVYNTTLYPSTTSFSPTSDSFVNTSTVFIYSSTSSPTDISYSTTTATTLTSSSYTVPTGYSLIEVIVGSNVTALSSSCFAGVNTTTTLTSVTLGNAVQSLGESCFFYSGLTSIIIPSTVTSLGIGCFQNCFNLASITIIPGTQSLTIGNSCFTLCNSLPSITIPSTVSYFDSYLFYGCSLLTSLIYSNPGAITVGGTDIFTNITSPMSVQFYNTNLSSVPTSGVYSSALYPEGSTTSYYSTTSCYNEETLVLILKNGVEKYVKIEDLRKGNLVKTHLHGYKPIEMIGKNKIINSKHNRLNSMYKINDLIVTGGHYILVDDLSGNKLPNTHSQFYELNLKIDNKHCLLACDYVNAKRIIDNNVYDIYHLVLEGKCESYGIYVNGLLSESTSKEHFIKQKFTLLNDN